MIIAAWQLAQACVFKTRCRHTAWIVERSREADGASSLHMMTRITNGDHMARHAVILCVLGLGIVINVNSTSPPDRWPVRDYTAASCEESTLALEKPLLEFFPGVPMESIDFSLNSEEDSLWAVGVDSLVRFQYSTGQLVGVYDLPAAAGE